MPKQQVGKECVSCATSRGRMRILIHMNTRRKKEKELQLFQKGRNCQGNRMANSKKTTGQTKWNDGEYTDQRKSIGTVLVTICKGIKLLEREGEKRTQQPKIMK